MKLPAFECGIVVLLIGIIGLLGWRGLFEDRFLNRSSKKALVEMHETFQIGDTRQRVAEVFHQYKSDRTILYNDPQTPVWEIRMPFEFGASDWVLYVEFDHEEKLSASGIRTSDGPYSKLQDSIEDLGRFTFDSDTEVNSDS